MSFVYGGVILIAAILVGAWAGSLIGIGVDENGDGFHDAAREKVRVAMFDAATKSLTYLTPE